MAKGLTGLAHIGVRVSDMQRSLKFYVNELGFELTHLYERPGGTQLGFVQAGTCIIELIYSPNVDVAALTPGQVDHICLECDDIAAYWRALRARSRSFRPSARCPTSWVARATCSSRAPTASASSCSSSCPRRRACNAHAKRRADSNPALCSMTKFAILPA